MVGSGIAESCWITAGIIKIDWEMVYMQFIQPYISDIVQALVGILVMILLMLLASAKAWIQSHTTVNQRELLHKLGEEGFSYAKTVLKDQNADQKLAAAMSYVNQKLSGYGVHLDEPEVRAAVEKAYLNYKAQVSYESIQAEPLLANVEPPKPIEVIPPLAQQLIDAALIFAQNQPASEGTKQNSA